MPNALFLKLVAGKKKHYWKIKRVSCRTKINEKVNPSVSNT